MKYFSDSYWQVANSLIIGGILTAFSYFIGLQIGWIDSLNWIEIVAVLLNFSCVILTVSQNIINWPIGIIACGFLGVLFWNFGLYSSMFLNLAYFIPVQIWGWYHWVNGGSKFNNLPVTKLSPKEFTCLNPTFIVSTGAVIFINQYFGGASPVLDTLILSLSVVSQYLLTIKKQEAWIGWTLVNILSIYVYMNAGLFVVGMQYLFFLVNSFAGLYVWNKSRVGANQYIWGR